MDLSYRSSIRSAGIRSLSAPFPTQRRKTRGPEENRATGLVQNLLNDPDRAAADLDRDLKGGAGTDMVGAFLDTAVGLARSRGVDISKAVERVKGQLRRLGYAF